MPKTYPIGPQIEALLENGGKVLHLEARRILRFYDSSGATRIQIEFSETPDPDYENYIWDLVTPYL